MSKTKRPKAVETLGQLIDRLLKMQEIARFGADTAVYVCVPEVEPVPIVDVVEERDPDGSIVWVKIKESYLE